MIFLCLSYISYPLPFCFEALVSYHAEVSELQIREDSSKRKISFSNTSDSDIVSYRQALLRQYINRLKKKQTTLNHQILWTSLRHSAEADL